MGRKYEDLTGVRLGKKIIDRLDALGRAMGRNRSELIREGITLLFQKYGILEMLLEKENH